MSPVPSVRARLRAATVIAAVGAVVAAGLLVPSSASADDTAPPTQDNVLAGGSLSADGWTGPAVDDSSDFDFTENGGALQASNYTASGLSGDIVQLESPTTQEAGEPGYTDATHDEYNIQFTIDGNATGDDKYAAQPNLSLEVDADQNGNRAGGGLYFSVPTDNTLEIDNFSSTDPFGNLWSGATTQIPFDGPINIDYTVQFVAGGTDIVTVTAGGTTVLSSADGTGTYEGYTYGVAAGTDSTAPATAPDADAVDQVLFRATTSVYDPTFTPGNSDPDVTPWTHITAPSSAGQGFVFSNLQYGAEDSGAPAFASSSTVTTAANQIADYEDASTYDSWHAGNNDDPTDTTDYVDVLANGDVQLNDPNTNDSHVTQFLKGIPGADEPDDLYALVDGGLAWDLPTDNLASYQIALTANAVATASHFTTLHSESQTEHQGLNLVRLSDPWVSTHAIGSIPANTVEPLGVLLAALEPNVSSTGAQSDIDAAGVSVEGFGVANEAIAGQSATEVGPIYFGGVEYTFTAASSMTLHTPTITGTPAVGQSLVAAASVTPSSATPAYQWLRNGVAISGAAAKAKTYTATTADYGKKLSVKVTETATGFVKTSATSAATAKVGLGTMTKTGNVGISGTAQVGIKLSLTEPTFTPASAKLSYQWQRNGTSIKDATAATYTVAPADLGTALSVLVTAKATDYTPLPAQSSATATVIPGVLDATLAPTIKGTAKAGKILTATSTGWTANGVATTKETKRYYWFISDGTSTPDFTDLVQVSTTNTLKLAYWAQGLKVSVYVSGVAQGYTSAITPLSAFTATVQ